MNELIKIAPADLNGAQIQTVNARELHAFLECKTPFTRWIKKRIEDFGFVEGQDFVRVELPAGMKMSENGGEIGGIGNAQKSQALESMGYVSFGQQGRIEYAVSINMAKELSMVERSEKGKQARLYFIQCEQKLKEVTTQQFQLPDFTNPAIAARAWAEQFEKAQALQMKVETDKPLVEFAETIQESNEDFLIRKAAKLLGVKVKFLFGFLRQQQWIFKTSSEPYAVRVHQGLMTVKVGDYKDKTGESKHSITGYLTFKGLKRLHDDLKSLGKIPQEHQLELNI